MRTVKQKPHAHRRRHGQHQKRSNKFLKVYTPYLPMVLLVIASIVLSLYPSSGSAAKKINGDKASSQGVLAYATNVSVSGLLGSTNQKRSESGIRSLSINGTLNTAAQLKANDMVARNYWSHNTPDGSPPWVFITNAGYSYSRAGENLAYGYMSSPEVINGWWDSPTHKANMLDANFTEVGFGYANSADFNNSGNQTVVVAMYASPYTAPAPAPTPTSPPPPSQVVPSTTNKSSPTPTAPTAPSPEPTPQPEVPITTNSTDSTNDSVKTPVPSVNNTDSKVLSDESTTFTRLQTLTGASLPWLGSLLFVLSLSGAMIVLGKHGLSLHNFVLKGERYVLQHTLFDMTIISLIVFSYIATRSVGVIL